MSVLNVDSRVSNGVIGSKPTCFDAVTIEFVIARGAIAGHGRHSQDSLTW
jgi:hypothetical protein